MSSQSYLHGQSIYNYEPAMLRQPDPNGAVRQAGVVRGDIIQLREAHFVHPNGGWQVAGVPDHTAVVTGVESNGVLMVVQQNVGKVKKVQIGTYDMAEMTKGAVVIYRAVGKDWIGDLSAEW